MPDNWGFVLAAYGLTGLALGIYWRWLARREHELARLESAERNHSAPRADHPRSKPSPGHSLQ
ncbi:MAG: heme exporter protein CcmD [Candidatus Rokubacteria bacterium]|nr:heme exporter protein CcmD [Candidatus Rokubacteria bacterium]